MSASCSSSWVSRVVGFQKGPGLGGKRREQSSRLGLVYAGGHHEDLPTIPLVALRARCVQGEGPRAPDPTRHGGPRGSRPVVISSREASSGSFTNASADEQTLALADRQAGKCASRCSASSHCSISWGWVAGAWRELPEPPQRLPELDPLQECRFLQLASDALAQLGEELPGVA